MPMAVAALGRRRGVTSTEVLVVGLVLCAVGGRWLRAGVIGQQSLATAATVFCAVFVQALPFLALGVVVSGLVAVFVSPARLARCSMPWLGCSGLPATKRSLPSLSAFHAVMGLLFGMVLIVHCR